MLLEVFQFTRIIARVYFCDYRFTIYTFDSFEWSEKMYSYVQEDLYVLHTDDANLPFKRASGPCQDTARTKVWEHF